MIIRNNAANRRLVKQMRDIVEAEIGFRAHIDRTWNRGDDIRFEIGCVGLDSPLIVSTCVHEDGCFEILVRLLRQKFDADETWMLACRRWKRSSVTLPSLSPMTRRTARSAKIT